MLTGLLSNCDLLAVVGEGAKLVGAGVSDCLRTGEGILVCEGGTISCGVGVTALIAVVVVPIATDGVCDLRKGVLMRRASGVVECLLVLLANTGCCCVKAICGALCTFLVKKLVLFA